jgi:Arc/MetJ family transcription regulator
MRTNIEIDDTLMTQAMEASALPTKRAVVEEALRRLVEAHRKDERVRERRREALQALRGIDSEWNDGRFDEGEDPADW